MQGGEVGSKVDDRLQKLKAEFEHRFGGAGARLFRGPGRVNLLGEHTDYNDGYVLPIAIDRDVSIAARARSDRQVNLYSLDFQQTSSFSLDDIQSSRSESWSNYVRGIALMLEREGKKLAGLDAVLEGNVPIASGLSSSAAMEIGFALTFQCLAGFEMGGVEMALLAQKSEHEFIGVMCGIMDQYISRLGERDHALLIDCRSLQARPIPIGGGTAAAEGPAPQDVAFVVGDTLVRRELAGSEYNIRRAQCEEAVRLLQPALGSITALRDVTSAQLSQHAGRLSELVLKRARHVVAENERVLQGVGALESGDLPLFGQLMNASHDSLRDDYQVSCPELDEIVNAARSVSGVLGSRMTGAGFGGCTVSLVEKSAVSEFERAVTEHYQSRFGKAPAIYVTTAEQGAHEILS